MPNTLLKQVGVTTDGKFVMAGIFHMYASEGLSLEILFDLLNSRNMTVSWIHFYIDAVENGWKHKTIINHLQESLSDVYGIKYCNKVIETLNVLFH